MWICQEFILIRHVRIFCGSSSVFYRKFLNHLYKAKLVLGDIQLSNEFDTMMRTRSHRHSTLRHYDCPRTFEDYFELFGHKSCQRSYNKVFALLGMVDDSEHQLRVLSTTANAPWSFCNDFLLITIWIPHFALLGTSQTFLI